MDRIAFSLKMLVGTPYPFLKDVFLSLVSRDNPQKKKKKSCVSPGRGHEREKKKKVQACIAESKLRQTEKISPLSILL
jgi:hypothetical protein